MSGLYNMLFGYNPACGVILPMLGRSHDEYPRFRDCHVAKDNGEFFIDVYTRVGGNNRNQGYGEEKLYDDENFVKTFDDEFDNTYATYRFRVPEKWKKDFDLIIQDKREKVSDEYLDEVRKYFSEDFINIAFKRGKKDGKDL